MRASFPGLGRYRIARGPVASPGGSRLGLGDPLGDLRQAPLVA